jgi:hypothetical protein
MGEAELAVLDRFEEVTKRPELMLEFTLQPGEMYFINNYRSCMRGPHSRISRSRPAAAPVAALASKCRRCGPVHPHIQSRGIEAVPGRVPSYD